MKVPLGSPMKVALRLEGEATKSTLEPPPLMAAAVPESTLLPDSAVPPEGRKHASRERAAGQVPLQTTGASRVGCAPRHMQSILDETGFGMWVEQSTAGRSARAWQGAFLLRGCCGKCSKVGRLGPAVTMEHRIIWDATQPIAPMTWRSPDPSKGAAEDQTCWEHSETGRQIGRFSTGALEMVRDTGFEPVTPSVSGRCSTTELTALYHPVRGARN
jgi:hypothetical protein